MINVALLGVTRRWPRRDHVSLREIAKRLGITRNIVRRYLSSETTEPTYVERQSASAIDPYAFHLSGWLKTEVAKSLKRRCNLKQLHEDLTELGFKGSYDRVVVFARQWKSGLRHGLHQYQYLRLPVSFTRLSEVKIAPSGSRIDCD